MGSSEDVKSPKSEKSFSPALEQGQQNSNVHVYPDWAAMQACYGPRLPVPPYYNPAVASGHPPPPFMWGPPQAMVPPYGNPYAAFYAPGGVYTHPGVPLQGAHPNGLIISPSATMTEATAGVPLSIDTPAKSAKVNTDQGLMNKLKGFDGLAMSIGNGNGSAGAGGDSGISQSENTEGSSDGSGGSTTGVGQINKKRSREGTPGDTRKGKFVTPKSAVHSGDAKGNPSKVKCLVVAPGSDTDKSTGDVFSPKMTTALELRNSSSGNLVSGPIGDGLQDERELKRERRKQSNRESARRSRMRKQAEAEDLDKKVHALASENQTLKSEMNQLTEICAKLRFHNAAMLDKLKTARLGPQQHPVGTVNLLARVNNSGSTTDRNSEEGEAYESSGSRATKLRQLLDASPRADAVAAR